jgi:hypothetical protein
MPKIFHLPPPLIKKAGLTALYVFAISNAIAAYSGICRHWQKAYEVISGVLSVKAYGDASYYDAQSVKRLEDQVVSFRVRLGAGEYQYEMRCGEKEARLTEENGKWFPIASGSDEDLICQAVCQ